MAPLRVRTGAAMAAAAAAVRECSTDAACDLSALAGVRRRVCEYYAAYANMRLLAGGCQKLISDRTPARKHTNTMRDAMNVIS